MMNMKTTVGIVAFAVSAMIFAADGAATQAPASSQTDTNKSSVEGPVGGNPAVRQKRIDCSSEAQSKSLKGESLDRFMKECMSKR